MRAMVAALAVVASLTVAAPVAADPAPVYCGQNDVVDPRIGAVSLSPANVVIGRANKTVTLTVSASDDCGVKRMIAQLGPRYRDTPYVINMVNFTRISGTPANGVWRSTVTIPDSAYGGVWAVQLLEVYDTYYGMTQRLKMATTTYFRHETKTTLNNPRDKVYKTATLVGRFRSYGQAGPWKVKLQSHAPGKKWKTVATLKTNGWGDFSKKVTIKGTTYFRAVHDRSSTTVKSVSKTYKVKKK